MQRIMKKSKIHTATVTGLELYYEGSITIDRDLLELADMLPGEQVQVVNLNNGSRPVTYTISGERSSGTIVVFVDEKKPGSAIMRGSAQRRVP